MQFLIQCLMVNYYYFWYLLYIIKCYTTFMHNLKSQLILYIMRLRIKKLCNDLLVGFI